MSEKSPGKSAKKTGKAFLTRKQAGIILIVMGLFLILFIALFLYFNALRVQGLSQLFPADSTVALLEVRRDPGGAAFERFSEWLTTVPVFAAIGGGESGGTAGSSFLPAIVGETPWLGNFGFALVDSGNKQDVIFAGHVTDKEAALAALKKQENFAHSFVGDFFVMSQNEDAVKLILDSQDLTVKKLTGDSAFMKSFSTLPFGAEATLIVKPSAISDELMGFLNLQESAFAPFLRVLLQSYSWAALGLDVKPSDGFMVRSSLQPDAATLSIQNTHPLRGKFHASLLTHFPDEPLFLLGGTDLETQWNRWKAFTEANFGNSAAATRALVEDFFGRLFGEETSIEQDILALAQSEYTVAGYTSGTGTELHYLFATQIIGMETAQKVTRSLLENFATLAPFLSPEIRTVTLSNGKTGRELVANPEAAERMTESVGDFKIDGVHLKNRTWGLYLAIVDDHLVASTNLSLLKKSLEMAREESFRYGAAYKGNLSEVLSASDFVTVVNIDEWWRYSRGENLPAWLAPFPYAVSGAREEPQATNAATFFKFR